MFLKNVWYAASWADEIDADTLFARTIINLPIVLWRDEHGEPQALEDRCAHRKAPLSLGKRVEGGVQCGYHGIAFGKDGGCIHNPHGPAVSALSVRSYPVIDRYKIVWIWLGDPALANTDDIPDLAFADSAPDTAYSKGFLPTSASHQLISDNILDLTHADFLHPDTLGGGSVTRSKPRIEERENSSVFIEWLANNEIALPFIRSEMPHPDMLTDMWTSVLWHPNGVMKLRFGATPAGQPRDEGVDTLNAHLVTPETAITSHYFYFNTRNYRVEDGEYNSNLANALRKAFSTEDKPMIEGQQKRLGETNLFESDPVLLGTDQASTRARKVYNRLLEAECA